MFGAFNRMTFNRMATIEIQGSFIIDAECDVTVIGTATLNGLFDADLSPEMIFGAIREKFAAFVLEATNEQEFAAVRERLGIFEVVGMLDISFKASRFHVDTIEFTGTFAPGDKIVIDSKMLTFMKNSQNALQDMQGDFFDLNLGSNIITYTDNQTGRTVRLRITHRDKFV